ncbi:MAG: glycosyltransferase family 39 protein [Coriobacteriia bacterium]|nr:glycosyltransferase family 39 protein [Coriobacteriia bacterium]
MSLLARPDRPTRFGAVVFALMVVVAAALIAYKVGQQMRIGPYWDTFAFLANAAEFAGESFGYSELHRPPVLSLVTAALFSIGFPLHESVIQWVDGLASLGGLIAFYLIARRRFEPVLAAVGALLLLAVQPLWQYLGVGYTDFFSVSLSMWLIWACIKATEDHPAWYLLAGPLFTAALMTRYTAILIAFPVLVWVVFRWKPFYQAKYIGGGLLLAISAYVLPGARFYADRFGDVLFPFLVAFGMYEDFSAPTGQFTPDPAAEWLVRSLPTFLGGERVGLAVLLVLMIATLGLGLGVVTHLQNRRPKIPRIVLGLFACVPAVLAQLLGGGLVVRQITIPIAIVGLWSAIGTTEDTPTGRRLTAADALSAVIAAWLLAYFDFHGHERIQVPRYVITMAPPIVFLILQGFRTFVTDIQRTLGAAERTPETTAQAMPAGRSPRSDAQALRLVARYAAPAALALFLVPAMGIAMAETAAQPPDVWTIAARETSAYLREQPGIEDATVLSELWPITAWYARIPVKAMQRFEEATAFQHSLDKNVADYYVTIHDDAYHGYAVGMTAEGASVLTRTTDAPDTLPRVLYLGKAWDNYLEQVTGYTFYLTGDQGPQEWGRMVFLDAMSADALAAFDAVAVYGVRWHDRTAGEAALYEYVAEGGSIVVDASANLGNGPFNLQDTVMFETVMRRAPLDPGATIQVGAELVAIQPDLGSIRAARFVDADGGRWFGADYTALPGNSDLRTLATVGDRPLIAVQEVGEGRVYWIGYNLVWHAFTNENAAEQDLITAVFADALAHARTAE